MGFYREWIVPALIDLSMRNEVLRTYRARIAGAAQGRVLDVGVGSGLNLPFYAGQVVEIFGLDPSPRLLARAQTNAAQTQCPVRLIEGSAERIPLADRSVDTIVMTWTGCSMWRRTRSSFWARSGRTTTALSGSFPTRWSWPVPGRLPRRGRCS